MVMREPMSRTADPDLHAKMRDVHASTTDVEAHQLLAQ
jgi:hypothetical protein